MLVKNCMAFLTFLTCVQAVSNATLCVIKLICFVWEKLRSMSEESGKETPQNGEGMEATTMKDDNIKRGIVPCENPPSPGTATFYTPQGDKNQRAVGGRKLHLQRKCGTMKNPEGHRRPAAACPGCHQSFWQPLCGLHSNCTRPVIAGIPAAGF